MVYKKFSLGSAVTAINTHMINDSFIDEKNQTSAGWSLVNFGVNDDLN
jgi:hypothetical protein